MLPIISLLILAFALSLDGFGVGAMYGLRKIKIPVLSIAIIALMSGIVIFASMQIGVTISVFFSPKLAKTIGAVILICIGIWASFQVLSQKETTGDGNASKHQQKAPFQREGQTVFSIEVKSLGLVIQILRTPQAADVDGSGVISASEAALLGLALSLDAFGAGIGAAFIGFTPALTSIVIALASGSFIYLGLQTGLRYADLSWVRRLTVIPGCILILVGIMKLL